MKIGVITAPYTVEVQKVNDFFFEKDFEPSLFINNEVFPEPFNNLLERNQYAIISVKACAICTWEQRVYKGTRSTYPFHGGHEIAGTIEKTTKELASSFKPGDLVAVARLARCGHCSLCKRGFDNLCQYSKRNPLVGETKLQGPGGFSDYILVPSYQLVKLNNEKVSYSEAALTEPVSCVIRSIKKANLQTGDTISIFGAGTMGLLHVKIAKFFGLRSIVLDTDERNREMALCNGADHAIDLNSEKALETILDITDGLGSDATILIRGRERELDLAINNTRDGGSIVLFSSYSKPLVTSINIGVLHSKEISLVGTTGQSLKDFEEAALLISNKIIDTGKLITAEYDLNNIKQALNHAIKPGSNRVIVKP